MVTVSNYAKLDTAFQDKSSLATEAGNSEINRKERTARDEAR